MGRSRGTLPIQLAGNIKHGGLVESRLRRDAARAAVRLRRRHAERPSDPRGAGRRPARGLHAGVAVRHAAGLRGVRRAQAHAGPRRHRGIRRHGRHGRAGALRDGVLRHRILRQVHALPHRLDARRRSDRPSGGRRECGRARGAAARSVRHHDLRIAVRAGRPDALSGAVGAEPFSRRFCQNQERSASA